MRIIQIITATGIAVASTSTAFAASPTVSNLSQSAQFIQSEIDSAEVIQVSERGHKYKKHKKENNASRRARENREARLKRQQHGHSHDHGHYDHKHEDSNLDKVLGVLGAASIISNLN